MRITQKKGDIAVAQAISTFTKMGFDVSLPVTESAAYDVIVDTPEGLKRVQVRYTSIKEVASGEYILTLKATLLKNQRKIHMIGYLF